MTATSETIAIQVNGEDRLVDPRWTVADLLNELGYGGRPIAVERNRHVVPRAKHAETRLHAGDSLELVGFVGGG